MWHYFFPSILQNFWESLLYLLLLLPHLRLTPKPLQPDFPMNGSKIINDL